MEVLLRTHRGQISGPENYSHVKSFLAYPVLSYTLLTVLLFDVFLEQIRIWQHRQLTVKYPIKLNVS